MSHDLYDDDDLYDDEFDSTCPKPIFEREVCIDQDLQDWAEHVGLTRLITMREGATFVRLDKHVQVIPILGGQPLHHDRHIEPEGLSPDTWNLVVSPSEGQGILLENDANQFEHHPLESGLLFYFSTRNRHAVTRRSRDETVVILQAEGFGPDQRNEAIAAMRAACSRRQIQGYD